MTDTHTENVNTVLGVLYTFAGVGALIGPWLVGWGIDLLDQRTGFGLNLLLSLLTLVSFYVLWKGKPHVETA